MGLSPCRSTMKREAVAHDEGHAGEVGGEDPGVA